MIEIASLGHRQHRAENFFLENARLRIDVRDHRRLDEVSVARSRVAARDQPAFPLAGLDVIENGLLRARTDHRTHVIRRILGRADRHRGDFLADFLDELVVDACIDNGARACRTLLPLIAVSRLHHARRRAFEIGFAVDDDRVFAAHFRDYALDPDLPFARLCSQLIDAQTNVARSGEGDETRLGMLDQKVADHGSAAGAQR